MTQILIRLPFFELLAHATGGIIGDERRGIVATFDNEHTVRFWSGPTTHPSDCYEPRFELIEERRFEDFYGDYAGGLAELLDDYLNPYAVILTDACNTAGGSCGAQETHGDHCGTFPSLEAAAAFVAAEWDQVASDMWGRASWPVELVGEDDAVRDLGADNPAVPGARWTIIERSPATRMDDAAYQQLLIERSRQAA